MEALSTQRNETSKRQQYLKETLMEFFFLYLQTVFTPNNTTHDNMLQVQQWIYWHLIH